ncbi:MAG TPA: right-handed parallel beta-helix repeat-containing protein [Candidatus Hydrogenedentes bacterium]|nr:right-handed parallel beta-helix repeat-containing protein [Candidatus Hydrogenedentota bacterium]HOV74646.1 right-handed parallel beta-helix repeat-containing protein [Candidatus Hydrogenedentota bacterium]HPC15568.1 right-handed parallel beta-helix repeat-containing protein [Candidatus Hydrogenedentota bacterium]HRT19388.1 right-handed parallel beta-helix repeat-containing protein [Candidatus Hydrogenedentota bacterium]HRT63878.1 right-handed parallel beta-helix repeat-containing protein [
MPGMLCRASIVVALALVPCLSVAQEAPVVLYVAGNGNDGWSGTLSEPNGADGPLKSIERARDAIRAMKAEKGLPKGGVRVEIRGGVYFLEKTLTFAADDSGTADSPLVYSGFGSEEARIVGGIRVEDFSPVTDAGVLNRLDPSARGHVVQADLKAIGITDFGAPSGDGLELFFNDKPMTLSRWPNDGFVRIKELVVDDGHKIHGIPGSTVGKFVYDGDRPKRWVGEKDGWLHGYWFWDWSDQRQKIESIDTEKSILAITPPYHNYGYRKGQWYYAFNLLSELDSPGEWHLDRETGILYFWPPAPIADGEAVVSVLDHAIVAKDVSYLTIRKLRIEATRGTAIAVSGGSHNRVAGCVIRNVGGSAVSMGDSPDSGVYGCDLCQMGKGGISLSGGDRATLTPANMVAENNHIHHYSRWARMYNAAISLHGVGNRAAHNLIHDAPHMAISFGGNDHVIEYNEIYNVCEESNDAGAMYAGRDWTMRGHIIRFNYLHQIRGFEGRGCVGVYLDDMFASAAIFGNIFHEVTMAAFIGGGRDNTIENNVFVDCSPALHIDARALGWAGYHADGWIKEHREKGTVCNMAYNKPPYSDRYPQLAGMMEDEPKAPKGNLIARNICVGGKWDDIEDKARGYLKFEDNLLDADPRFVDAANKDFRLKEDSPAFKLGFKPIPVEKIGPYPDADRASWPIAR